MHVKFDRKTPSFIVTKLGELTEEDAVMNEDTSAEISPSKQPVKPNSA